MWVLKIQPFYPSLRRAVRDLVVNGNISEIITATYSRLLVDEYQDCNSEQHELTCALSCLLPTVVFGDPMQCIFNFSGPMPHWNQTVETFSLLWQPYKRRGVGTMHKRQIWDSGSLSKDIDYFSGSVST